jgi:hypothetical protein
MQKIRQKIMQWLLMHDISANCQKDRTVIFSVFANILMNNNIYETRSISIDSPYNLLQNDVYTLSKRTLLYKLD